MNSNNAITSAAEAERLLDQIPFDDSKEEEVETYNDNNTPGKGNPGKHKFNAVDFLNAHFQTESELTTSLPYLRSAVAEKIERLDESISSCINSTAMKAKEVKSYPMRSSLNDVQNLRAKISAIQNRASASEKTVQEITNKMQKLDLAKGHLQRTITALKRLHMLTSATERLREVVKYDEGDEDGVMVGADFRDAANLLDAVQLLLGHFEAYNGVKRISDAKQQVEDLRKLLERRILRDFEGIGELVGEEDEDDMEIAKSLSDESLSEACGVLEALGEKECKRQIDAFCIAQLAPYERSFGKKKSYVENIGGLDYVDRRFAWFRKLLKALDKRFQFVFPSNWPVHYKLTCLFLLQVRFFEVIYSFDQYFQFSSLFCKYLNRFLQTDS